MKQPKYSPGDKVYIIVKHLSDTSELPYLHRATIRRTRNSGYAYDVAIEGLLQPYVAMEESIITFEEAVAGRLAGKVRL